MIAVFCERELVSATRFEARATSANSVMRARLAVTPGHVSA
jgi:hypothetical protein